MKKTATARWAGIPIQMDQAANDGGRETSGARPTDNEKGLAMANTAKKRTQILVGADTAINGDRDESYGDAAESFNRIAEFLNAAGFQQGGGKIVASDVAIIMSLVKIARLTNSPTHEDSWMDLAGYAALGAEVAIG